MEALHALEVRAVDATRGKVLNGDIDFVVVVGVVLKGKYLPRQAIFESLARIQI